MFKKSKKQPIELNINFGTDRTMQNINKDILQERNQELVTMKRQLQVRYDNLQIKFQTLTYEYDAFRSAKLVEVQDFKKKIVDDKKEYDMYVSTYTNAVQSYKKLQQENQRLLNTIEKQKKQKKVSIADLQREKMITIDALKKQMMHRAYDMRNKAMQIRKQQLDTTTRITFLQNDQLIRQLQFQSKNTEKVIFQNCDLKKKVKELEQKIDIHEMVEKQFAKRNVIAKKLVLNLKKSQNKQNLSQNSFDQRKENNEKQFLAQQQNQQKEYQYQIINKLNKALVDRDKKYSQIQKQYENFKANKQKQFENSKVFKDYCNNIAFIMVKFYHNLVQQKIQVKESQISFSNLQDKNVQLWTKQQIQKVIKIILTLLRPYLSLKVLGLPFFKEKQQQNKLDYEELTHKKGSKYYEALKRRKISSLDKLDKLRSFTSTHSKQKIPKVIRESQKFRSGKNIQSIAQRFLRKK